MFIWKHFHRAKTSVAASRDHEYRARPVDRAHMMRPLDFSIYEPFALLQVKINIKLRSHIMAYLFSFPVLVMLHTVTGCTRLS